MKPTSEWESASISMVNAGLQGFVRAAAMELKNHIRVNLVSPVFVKETMKPVRMESSTRMPASQVVLAYKESLESNRSGEVFDVRDFSRN